MEKQKCPKYDLCNVPLCPLDPESLKDGVWYPDEEICRKKGWSYHKWIRIQKRIKEVGADTGLYFDYEMLKNKGAVQKGVKGKDPDRIVKDLKRRDDKI